MGAVMFANGSGTAVVILTGLAARKPTEMRRRRFSDPLSWMDGAQSRPRPKPNNPPPRFELSTTPQVESTIAAFSASVVRSSSRRGRRYSCYRPPPRRKP